MYKIISNLSNHKWILLILGLATFLRFYHIDFQSMWMDELYTMKVSNPAMSWLEFHKELIAREGFPHLYFLILKLFYWLFGFTSVAARSVSVLAGIASIYAIYLVGKVLHSKKAGLFSALLLTINSYHIYSSQDARPYTLYILFVCLSFYRLILFLKDTSWKNTLYYALFTGLLLNFNFFGLLNVFSQCLLFVLFLFLTPKEKRFDFFKKIAIAGNIILVMFAVNYQKFFELLKYNNFWVAPPAPDSFSKIFHSFFGDSEIVLFLIMPLLFYYLLLVFKNNENKIISCQNLFNNKIQFGFIILFTWFFVFFSYLMIKSYGKISYLLTRYFISISPVIFIILGIAIKKIKGLVTRGIVLFLLCFFMLVHLFVVKKQYYTIHHAQYREAAAFVIKNNPNAITTYSNQEYWYNFYFNKTKTKIVLKNLSLNKVCEKFIKTPTDIKSFWYIDAFKRFDSVKQSSKDFLDKNFVIKKEFKGHKAWATYYVIKEKSETK